MIGDTRLALDLVLEIECLVLELLSWDGVLGASHYLYYDILVGLCVY